MDSGDPHTASNYGRLFKYLSQNISSKNKRVLGALLAVRILIVALDVVGLYLLGIAISLAVYGDLQDEQSRAFFRNVKLGLDSLQLVAVVFSLALMFFLLKGVLSYIVARATARRIAKIETEASAALYRRVAFSDLELLDTTSPKHIAHALLDSADYTVGRILNSYSTAISEIALILAVSVFLVIQEPLLFLVVGLFFTAVVTGISSFVNGRAARATAEIEHSTIKSQIEISQLLENFAQARTTGSEEFFARRFLSVRSRRSIATAELSILAILPRYIFEVALIFALGLIAYLKSTSDIFELNAVQAGIFAAGFMRIAASLLPLQGVSTLVSQIARGAKATVDLFAETHGQIVTPVSRPVSQKSSLEFRNVSYTYPGASARTLNRITFSAPYGSITAITGKSGSGKSTIADLICGLRKPQEGSIVLKSETGVQQVAVTDVGYVPQTIRLLEGTLRDNVTMFDNLGKFSDQAVTKSLAGAGLNSYLKNEGISLETQLGVGLKSLSGGELQRLGIARALLHEPTFIIFDESTSALDEVSQAEIIATLLHLKETCGVILVAHRPEVVEIADIKIALQSLPSD